MGQAIGYAVAMLIAPLAGCGLPYEHAYESDSGVGVGTGSVSTQEGGDSSSATATGEVHPTATTSTDGQDPDGDSAIRVLPPSPCELEVVKHCSAEPSQTGDACVGKVTGLVFAYTGAPCSASSHSQKKAKCQSSDPADGALSELVEVVLVKDHKKVLEPDWVSHPGHVILTASSGHFGAETILHVFGANGIDQVINVHTSCSQPLMRGDQFGALRLVDLTTTKRRTVGRGTRGKPPEPVASCSYELGSQSCESVGKPVRLSFRYNSGSTCGDSANDQGNKFQCTDLLAGQSPGTFVSVEFTGHAGKVKYEESIDSAGEVVLTFSSTNQGGKLTSEIEFDIVGSDGLQSLKIHTSCSQPLELGDVFGSLTLVGINGQGQEAVVEYSYEVTNIGSVVVSDLQVIDDVLGPIACTDTLQPGEQVFCTATMTLDTVGSYVNTVSVTGIGPSGSECSAQASATVAVVPELPCHIQIDHLKVKKKKKRKKDLELELSNTGNRTATLDHIAIIWPTELGKLKKIKAGRKTISRTPFEPNSADLGDFTGHAKDRQIKAGKSMKLKFEFSDGSDVLPEQFSVQADFAEGCSVGW